MDEEKTVTFEKNGTEKNRTEKKTYKIFSCSGVAMLPPAAIVETLFHHIVGEGEAFFYYM